ncbi:MAG: hypothetical protein FJW95_04520 [Actinobacteria bacterium]|nr:hypothetical protein [Actinomycetota bacterium]
MTVSERTHYEVIDADPRAAKADLKAAYASALETAQSAGDADEVAAVRRAWQVLSDPVQRQRYDEENELTGRGAPARPAEVVEAEVVDDDGEVVEAEVVDDDELAAMSPKEMRQRLFHHVPEFLEQPTLGRRITASLIDVITTVAVFAATGGVAYAALGGGAAFTIALIVLFEIWVVGMYVVPTLRTGQTLGKRFTYIMCVDRETGNLPTLAQLVRRYILPMVAVPALFQMGAFLALFYGLSYAMAKDQLSLADRLAKTVVVVARYKPTRDGTPA